MKLYSSNEKYKLYHDSMQSDVINSVEKGIFMKQIENIKEQVKNGEIVGRNLLQEKNIYKLETIEDEL